MTVTVLAWVITTVVWLALWVAVPLPTATGAAGFLLSFVFLYLAVLRRRMR